MFFVPPPIPIEGESRIQFPWQINCFCLVNISFFCCIENIIICINSEGVQLWCGKCEPITVPTIHNYSVTGSEFSAPSGTTTTRDCICGMTGWLAPEAEPKLIVAPKINSIDIAGMAVYSPVLYWHSSHRSLPWTKSQLLSRPGTNQHPTQNSHSVSSVRVNIIMHRRPGNCQPLHCSELLKCLA